MLTEEKAELAHLIRENLRSARELRECLEKYPNAKNRKDMWRLWYSFMDRVRKMRVTMYGYFCLEEIFN